MPAFHLSTVPHAAPRHRPNRAAVREALQQDLQAAGRPAPKRGLSWWRALGPRPGLPGGGFLPR
jgi:hypothetical protein